MKKLIILKLVVLFILMVSCSFGYFKYHNIKHDITLLKLSVKQTKQNIKRTNEEIEEAKANVKTLKETKEDSVWEYDTWKQMKEKIENAL